MNKFDKQIQQEGMQPDDPDDPLLQSINHWILLFQPKDDKKYGWKLAIAEPADFKTIKKAKHVYKTAGFNTRIFKVVEEL